MHAAWMKPNYVSCWPQSKTEPRGVGPGICGIVGTPRWNKWPGTSEEFNWLFLPSELFFISSCHGINTQYLALIKISVSWRNPIWNDIFSIQPNPNYSISRATEIDTHSKNIKQSWKSVMNWNWNWRLWRKNLQLTNQSTIIIQHSLCRYSE